MLSGYLWHYPLPSFFSFGIHVMYTIEDLFYYYYQGTCEDIKYLQIIGDDNNENQVNSEDSEEH